MSRHSNANGTTAMYQQPILYGNRATMAVSPQVEYVWTPPPNDYERTQLERVEPRLYLYLGGNRGKPDPTCHPAPAMITQFPANYCCRTFPQSSRTPLSPTNVSETDSTGLSHGNSELVEESLESIVDSVILGDARKKDNLEEFMVLSGNFPKLNKIRYSEQALRNLCPARTMPPRSVQQIAEIFIPPPHMVERQRKKTVCLDWLKGKCDEKRWKCKFAHPPLPYLPVENSNSFNRSQIPVSPNMESDPTYRPICDVWRLTGSCKFGNSCWYAHPPLPNKHGLLCNSSTHARKENKLRPDVPLECSSANEFHEYAISNFMVM